MKMNQVNKGTVKNVVSQWNVGGFLFLEANWRTSALAAQEIKSQQRNKAEQLDKSGLDEKKKKANKLVDGFMLNHAWWNKTRLPKQQVSSLFSPPPPPPPPTPLPRKKTQLTVGDLNVLQSSQIIFKRSELRFLSYLRKRLIHFSRALAFFPPGCLWIIRSTHPILLCKVHPLVPPLLSSQSTADVEFYRFFLPLESIMTPSGYHYHLWFLASCSGTFLFSLTSGPIAEKMP